MHIVFPVFDRFQILDVCGPLQVFATANEELALAGQPQLYTTRMCALKAGHVVSSGGVIVQAQPLPARPTRSMHTVIVPGGPGVWNTPALQPLVDWLHRSAHTATRLASVCTGAFLLARSGLLDGVQATTHWSACERLHQEFPAVQVQSDAIFLHQGRLWTSAGVTSGIDMALAMVEADIGRAIAMAVAKKLVVFYRRPGGQSQFSSALLEQTANHSHIEQLHHWIRQHLRETLYVEQLAAYLAMTPRTFARFYRQHTGTTPAHAVEQIRLERACTLLEEGHQSAKAVAQACGFASEEVMRRVFLRRLKVSPSGYRERFSSQW